MARKREGFWLPQGVLQRMIPEERLQSVMSLFPGKTRREVEYVLHKKLCKTMMGAMVVSVILLVVGMVFAGREEKTSQVIQRPGAGGTEIIQQLQMEGKDGWETFDLVVAPLEYTEEEIEKLHQRTEEYLDVVVPGDNEGFSHVETNLYFPEELPQGFEVRWSTDALSLLDAEGKVRNDAMEETAEVLITAKVYYGSEFRLYERRATVYPKQYTKEEEVLLKVKETLRALEEESRTEEKIEIPVSVNGRTITFAEEKTLTGVFFGLVTVLVPVLFYLRFFSQMEEKKKKQTDEAKKGYTELVTKLSLLLVAGISMRQAFGRLCKEYEKSHGETYVLTKELHVTYQALSNGCPEAVAYEAFGDRIGLVAYQRMAALLAQNCTKGVKNMREFLLHEAKEVMAEERAGIKIRGEQTGTKLLLPMMGFLVLIFAILLVPAFEMF